MYANALGRPGYAARPRWRIARLRTFSIAAEGLDSRNILTKARKYSSSCCEPWLQAEHAGTVIQMSGRGLSKKEFRRYVLNLRGARPICHFSGRSRYDCRALPSIHTPRTQNSEDVEIMAGNKSSFVSLAHLLHQIFFRRSFILVTLMRQDEQFWLRFPSEFPQLLG